MTNQNESARERIRCNTCNKETWHERVAGHSVSFPILEQEEIGPDEISTSEIGKLVEDWELYKCLGCESITVKITTEDQTDEDHPRWWNYLPESNREERRKKTFLKTPDHLNRLYQEVITAYNQGLFVLCAGGIRALLEGICVDKKITRGMTTSGQVRDTLEGKINGLTTIVPEGIVKNLHGLRFLGNQALHELEVPSKWDLELSLTVIEDILNVVYDLDYRADLLHKRVKPRRKRKR